MQTSFTTSPEVFIVDPYHLEYSTTRFSLEYSKCYPSTNYVYVSKLGHPHKPSQMKSVCLQLDFKPQIRLRSTSQLHQKIVPSRHFLVNLRSPNGHDTFHLLKDLESITVASEKLRSARVAWEQGSYQNFNEHFRYLKWRYSPI